MICPNRLNLQDGFSTQDRFMTSTNRCQDVSRKTTQKNNAPVLDEYKSVGSRLKSLYPDGKFPSETSLDRQRQALYEEREKLYEEYRYLKKEYADLDKASRTIDDYLEV